MYFVRVTLILPWLELAEHNIHVQTVLPGAVESNLGLHAFTENIDEVRIKQI